ncbi:nucleotide exchange factor GrpE [Mycoplasmopsis cynos]|uniref:Protein GrpE n=1 Tax=Mycoplasmopsis cynos TaxID=171284 RepID=A0ABD8AKM3_9BACT|nr:nucleotide exchange factor GrpE [Mycoplasmopsis cynos]MCU9934902.1 nucleotide exchange factor GrpE [Mycoplasmopsis cynos]UWV80885.1 nucleotide exchange factor GrpE [Mycoplasmopsis cynos]WAM05601.1 nucleotide exchange factor GrpE [Mycoplasmopsis cynos]WAM09111.1 nucleotide exchange factor GrpE [Mycoplasmopsis cynos]WQQ13430.1 nucleotide exchange factor GrpE [Mycoplasmopsis cynos]
MNQIKIKNNDKLKAKFKLFVNGVELENYTKEQEVVIGKNQYLPNFDDFLIGRKLKSKLEIKVFFPKNYSIAEIAGKKSIIELSDVELISNNNYEEIEKLKNQVSLLETKLATKELEIYNINNTFKNKASEFSKKTQEKIEQVTSEYNEKLIVEKNEIKKYALQSFLESFAIPFNNFISAISAGQNSPTQEVQNYCLGFNIVSKQFENLLEENGVQLIRPELNTEFNPEFQEAIDFKEDSESHNKVLKVVRLGFSLNGRVVVPASVILSKKISN